MRRKVTTGVRKKKPAVGRKTTRRRRRGISGIGSMDVKGIGMQVVGLTAGAAAGWVLNSVLKKQFPTLTPTVSGLIQIGVGVMLPKVVKGNAIINNVGMGLIAQGGVVELVNFGIISGAKPDRMNYRVVNGAANLSAIAGSSRFHRIAGAADLSPVANMGGMAPSRRVNKNKMY